MFNSKKTNKQETKSNKNENESEIQTLSVDQLAAVSGGCCCCCYRPRRGHYGRWC